MQSNHLEVPENPEGRITLTPRKGTIIEDYEFSGRADLKDAVIPYDVILSRRYIQYESE